MNPVLETAEPQLFKSDSHEAAAARFVKAVDRKEKRASSDFYPTPPSATFALMGVEAFAGPIWEPACGSGDMSEALKAGGYDVISTDLVDRGYGEARRDFLFERESLAPNIVTNPPYIISLEFVRHAVRLAPAKVAMLLRLSWLEGGARGQFFAEHPPARVWVFSKRVTIHRSEVQTEGGGMMAYAWFVWERGVTDTRLGWVNPTDTLKREG